MLKVRGETSGGRRQASHCFLPMLARAVVMIPEWNNENSDWRYAPIGFCGMRRLPQAPLIEIYIYIYDIYDIEQ